MLADDATEAVRWGAKAMGLARALGDREAEMHALNNVGTALSMAGDPIEGRARLTQSLDLALADDAHEHAARAYTNLGSSTVMRRSYREADQHLRAGIAYCTMLRKLGEPTRSRAVATALRLGVIPPR
jgi:Tfp pilus assembly protein PilF